MNTRKLFSCGLLALATIVLGGCVGVTARRPVPAAPVAVAESHGAIDAAWLKPSTAEFTLGPGDRLAIEVGGESTSRVETVVGPDGKIYYEMLPGRPRSRPGR